MFPVFCGAKVGESFTLSHDYFTAKQDFFLQRLAKYFWTGKRLTFVKLAFLLAFFFATPNGLSHTLFSNFAWRITR